MQAWAQVQIPGRSRMSVPPHSDIAPAHASYIPDVWRDAKGGWSAFYQQWWGSAGAARLRQAAQDLSSLRIEQEDVCRELHFLEQTSGWLRLLPRLTAAYTSILNAHCTGMEGVVFIGQPGSGRSFLLLVVLLFRMAAAEPFHYTTLHGTIYRFDETGVTVASARKLCRFDVVGADSESTPWSLVDSNADASSPPYAVTSRAVFTVHMAGVQDSEYKWTSRTSNGSATRLLDPWTCSEILECLALRTDFCRLDKTYQEAYTTERIKTAAIDRDHNPGSLLGPRTERLFALEESDDDNVWQVSVGMFDIFPTW